MSAFSPPYKYISTPQRGVFKTVSGLKCITMQQLWNLCQKLNNTSCSPLWLSALSNVFKFLQDGFFFQTNQNTLLKKKKKKNELKSDTCMSPAESYCMCTSK